MKSSVLLKDETLRGHKSKVPSVTWSVSVRQAAETCAGMIAGSLTGRDRRAWRRRVSETTCPLTHAPHQLVSWLRMARERTNFPLGGLGSRQAWPWLHQCLQYTTSACRSPRHHHLALANGHFVSLNTSKNVLLCHAKVLTKYESKPAVVSLYEVRINFFYKYCNL